MYLYNRIREIDSTYTKKIIAQIFFLFLIL